LPIVHVLDDQRTMIARLWLQAALELVQIWRSLPVCLDARNQLYIPKLSVCLVHVIMPPVIWLHTLIMSQLHHNWRESHTENSIICTGWGLHIFLCWKHYSE
jgi:hypothetical protein